MEVLQKKRKIKDGFTIKVDFTKKENFLTVVIKLVKDDRDSIFCYSVNNKVLVKS